MITLNEIAYNIKNKMEGGRTTHNSFISLEQIKFNLDVWRELILRRDLQRDHDTRNFEQELCLPMEQIVWEDSGINMDFTFALESTSNIPQTIRMKHQHSLYVYNSSRNKVYPVIDYHRMHMQRYNKFTKNDPRAFILNNHLYLVGDVLSEWLADMMKVSGTETVTDVVLDVIPEVIVRGVFTRPQEVMAINGIMPTEAGDESYPITGDIVQRITEGLLKGELQVLQTSEPDIKHNNIPG